MSSVGVLKLATAPLQRRLARAEVPVKGLGSASVGHGGGRAEVRFRTGHVRADFSRWDSDNDSGDN